MWKNKKLSKGEEKIVEGGSLTVHEHIQIEMMKGLVVRGNILTLDHINDDMKMVLEDRIIVIAEVSGLIADHLVKRFESRNK